MPPSVNQKPLKKLSPGMGLYQVMHMPAKAPDKSKTWCVINLQTGDINGRWHASKEEALAQARAMYATMGDKAKVHSEEVVHNAFFLFADPATLIADDGVKWVEAMAPKTYVTPAYGDVIVSPDTIDNFVRNINTNIRGQDIAINYEHGIDPSKGLKAAGWIKQARKNDRGNLELAIDFTEPAKQELRNGEWKYFSLEWDDQWMHPDGGIFYQDVPMGGALTNRPIAKGLMPINFSEIFTEKERLDAAIELGHHLRDNPTITLSEDSSEYEFAVWSTAYVNSLPDSSFLYIDKNGRHLPYKDKNGKIDLPHLRNAAARVNQVTGIPSATVDKIKARIAKMLGSKNMSELLEIDAEQKEWEHSEPGTGSPPAPRTDELEEDDPDRTGGWRRDTPPIVKELEDKSDVTVSFSEAEAVGYLSASIPGLRRIHTNQADVFIERIDRILAIPSATRSFNELQSLTNEVRTYLRANGANSTSTSDITEGGNTVGELTDKDLRELRTVLDVDDDGKILESVKMKFGELAALRDAVSATEQERIFAEQYPQFYGEHLKLVEEQRKNRARQFSESVQKVKKAEGFGLKTTNQGLSTAAMEKLEDVYVKFSENKATVDDFEDVIKTILHGGIVMFGELGSSADEDMPEVDTSTMNGVVNARKLFAEHVAKWQREHPEEKNMLVAISEVSKKNPDLAEAYKYALPA